MQEHDRGSEGVLVRALFPSSSCDTQQEPRRVESCGSDDERTPHLRAFRARASELQRVPLRTPSRPSADRHRGSGAVLALRTPNTQLPGPSVASFGVSRPPTVLRASRSSSAAGTQPRGELRLSRVRCEFEAHRNDATPRGLPILQSHVVSPSPALARDTPSTKATPLVGGIRSLDANPQRRIGKVRDRGELASLTTDASGMARLRRSR